MRYANNLLKNPATKRLSGKRSKNNQILGLADSPLGCSAGSLSGSCLGRSSKSKKSKKTSKNNQKIIKKKQKNNQIRWNQPKTQDLIIF